MQAPPPVSFSPWQRMLMERRAERARSVPYPPGHLDYSLARTLRFARAPLPHLLDAYERFGPVFALRIMHVPIVFMLGPAANHYVLVSHAENFLWREGSLGDLIPLLGDGLLTTDGAYHRRARRILLPAFHRDRVLAATGIMIEEAERAAEALRPGERIDVHRWTRELALRVALRALFGIRPGGRDSEVAEQFERALSFYSQDYFRQLLRGPGSPFQRLLRSRRRLDELLYAEIAKRRAGGDHEGEDLLDLLLAARDENGRGFGDRELRDQLMTLLFAGHDTTTSTVTFLLYEMARNPGALERVYAEQDRVLGGRSPDGGDLHDGLPELSMAIDETLRLYPPAWIGPRRSVEPFELEGVAVPGGVPVNYVSWASHRLPDVFPEPDAFRPERFAPEVRAKLPKGAYVPFGGGSRMCLGMRFGELEVRAIATALLQRRRLELVPGRELSIRQMPTLSPRGGLPVTVRPRGVAELVAAAAR